MSAENSAEPKQQNLDSLVDLDDLLQCPVCYEIPSGQIFQCNEGHHVCGRCKARLALCPVCRSLFFGTRNYAMEELISNVRKLKAFKLGGKAATSPASNADSPAATSSDPSSSSGLAETVPATAQESQPARPSMMLQAPSNCKGMFRCLSCKQTPCRLPAGRLVNHLRYFHASGLIEGKSENGVYSQVWQVPLEPNRIVLAVRISDMGLFFLTIEVTDCIYAWISMVATHTVASEFTYTLTMSGSDREAVFCDSVGSTRACEGALKKRGRTLHVTRGDVTHMLRGAARGTGASCKLVVRRGPSDEATAPRSVLRIANRAVPTQHDDIDDDSNDDIWSEQEEYEFQDAVRRDMELGMLENVVELTHLLDNYTQRQTDRANRDGDHSYAPVSNEWNRQPNPNGRDWMANHRHHFNRPPVPPPSHFNRPPVPPPSHLLRRPLAQPNASGGRGRSRRRQRR